MARSWERGDGVLLMRDDKVVVVSTSSSAPQIFPSVLDQGVARLEAEGFRVQVLPSCHSSDMSIKAPADDLNKAFRDPEVRAIFAAIGGDDTVRLLPFLDEEAARTNWKPFFGFSDMTTLHFYLHRVWGGPSVLLRRRGHVPMGIVGEHAQAHALLSPPRLQQRRHGEDGACVEYRGGLPRLASARQPGQGSRAH
mmetsp:Transcript_7328/g.19693  ORF Transcript_7328/g.19693 Transcript_7328/m.19693 type:complete len:195 (+) Transcript_7328:99-683(+)